jgi:peptidoglycan/xylan/chitin deacetylase (PgdA/CDA1 family)
MMTESVIKRTVCRSLVMAGMDSLFRYINREKQVILMYHGITRRNYDPAVWTQLPVDIFRSQLKFLKDNYELITLEQLLKATRTRTPLPCRAAMLTFDDGLMNNFTVAFPLLKEFEIPATIFVASDYIGTNEILWFDEIYLLLKQLYKQGGNLSDKTLSLGDDMPAIPFGEFPLSKVLSWMKHLSALRRNDIIHSLRKIVSADLAKEKEDFCYLGWPEIKIMQLSGLVDFGVHTASHEILTNLTSEGLQREIIGSREVIEQHLERPVFSFCYPNGKPDDDFTVEHEAFLARNGYLCAFTTQNGLCGKDEDPFALKRIAVGNDWTSDPDYYRLNTSGLLDVVRKYRRAY